MAKNATHLTGAGTTTVVSVDSNPGGVLDRVVVGTGDSGATVELQHADDDSTISTIDASRPDIGRVYRYTFGDRGLKVVVTGSPDVTVLYD